MPELEVDDLTDYAVMLEAAAANRYGRTRTTDVPVEIRCRWSWRSSPRGGSNSDVTSVMGSISLDREIAVGSILWPGRLANFPKDWPNEASSELVEIVGYRETTGVDGRSPRKKADFARYRDALPET